MLYTQKSTDDFNSFKINFELDRQFLGLLTELKELSQEEILKNIKANFSIQDEKVRRYIENYLTVYPYWGSLNVANNDFTAFEIRAEALHNHWSDYLWLYQKLEDYRSRKILFAILSNLYWFDYETLHNLRDLVWPDYFDLDIVKCDKKEVLVDLGAYTGDTVNDFISIYGQNYKKIYCYEITPDNFSKLMENTSKYPNIQCIMKGVGKENKKMKIAFNKFDMSSNVLSNKEDSPYGDMADSLAIDAVTIDSDIKEPVTFIKMDIEGGEQNAIIGCTEHIKKDRPKLAISVYHNNEDLWKIPRMIDEIGNGEYKLWLRYHGDIPIIPHEITLIGIYPPPNNN